MKKAVVSALVAVAVMLVSGTSLAASGGASTSGSVVPSVVINGPTLGLSPLTLKTSELAILPQQTITLPIGGTSTTESGPLLSSVLTLAGVQYNALCKNDELRYWAEVTSTDGSAAVAITPGELDPGFGNRPAILSISENGKFLTSSGPRLIVPNDSGGRDIQHVGTITIGRAPSELPNANPACGATSLNANPPAGSVVVNGDVSSPMTLTMAQLAALPQVTQTDTFLQGTAPSVNTETGPTLYSILQLAKPKFLACDKTDSQRFYVEITSSEDGVPAVLAWSEIDPSQDNTQDLMALTNNNIPVLSSDTDPRLTTPGDVKGGRYIFGAAMITVFRAPTETRIPSCAAAK
ncbi:MAG TPA: hypothetical protein VG265_08235 [Gaiellaceae bacterium]|jgi:hypothetical protein|nr:hypothetical protein [Gaiellaceae bacterium]